MVCVRKGKYKVTNWAEYNEALVNRGSLTLWLDEESVTQWEHLNDKVKRGRPFVYSDTADARLVYWHPRPHCEAGVPPPMIMDGE